MEITGKGNAWRQDMIHSLKTSESLEKEEVTKSPYNQIKMEV